MSFEEVNTVIPHLEVHSGYGGANLDDPQPGCVRAFKTHRVKRWCPGGFQEDCKYIYVARNPVDVRASPCGHEALKKHSRTSEA